MGFAMLLIIIGAVRLAQELGAEEPAEPRDIILYLVLVLLGLISVVIVKSNGVRPKRKPGAKH